jgi:peptidoglycan/xylan/chitin deacetylase (PgdA/CDA1 family)
MRRLLDAALLRSPAQPLFLWRASRRLAVLAYHGIGDAGRFAQQLDHLRRDATPVSLEEVMRCIDAGGGLPHRAVLVTFDDADRSHLEVALPLMRERDVPGVAFVVTGLLDTQERLWTSEAMELARRGARSAALPVEDPAALVRAMKRVPDGVRLAVLAELRRSATSTPPPVPQLRRSELRLLEADGISVGNHSVTHPCLPRCDDATIVAEVEQGRRTLAEATGRDPVAFAYPNGEWDSRTLRAVANAGHRVSFLFDHRLSTVPPPRPLLVSRVRVNSTDDPDRYRTVLSGLHPAVYHVRLWLRPRGR